MCFLEVRFIPWKDQNLNTRCIKRLNKKKWQILTLEMQGQKAVGYLGLTHDWKEGLNSFLAIHYNSWKCQNKIRSPAGVSLGHKTISHCRLFCRHGDCFLHDFLLLSQLKNIFNVGKSHHHHPSVCSLCSFCLFPPSNSHRHSTFSCAVFGMCERSRATCLLAVHRGGKQDGEEKGRFSPRWHRRLQEGN